MDNKYLSVKLSEALPEANRDLTESNQRNLLQIIL